MYCGKGDGDEGDYIYVAYNMHWNMHRLGLPSIANYEWVSTFSTDENEVVFENSKNAQYIDLKPRSISILIGRKLPKTEKKSKASRLPKEATALHKKRVERKTVKK